jgi:hypothetical protein
VVRLCVLGVLLMLLLLSASFWALGVLLCNVLPLWLLSLPLLLWALLSWLRVPALVLALGLRLVLVLPLGQVSVLGLMLVLLLVLGLVLAPGCAMLPLLALLSVPVFQRLSPRLL